MLKFVAAWSLKYSFMKAEWFLPILQNCRAKGLRRCKKQVSANPSILAQKLTLKEPEHFGDLKAGGGLNQPTTVFMLLYSQFQWKSFIKGLKWKLASLSTCRVFEHHPKLCSFAVRWRRSRLLWPRKFSSFRYYNFWKVVIFDLHGQYVYQMKAENILNSNLT